MRTRSIAVASAATMVALLGACGGDSGGADPTPSPTSSSPTATPGTPGPPATPSPPATVPTPPSRPPLSPQPPPPTDKPGQTTLTGEVFAGVEAGCRLLRTSSRDYLLIGEPAESVRLGSTVTVRGQVRTDLATTCQQGTPFEVSEVLD